MIGPEGAMLIASVIPDVTAFLTELSLWNNDLGDAGEKAVQDAVMGRSGFQLFL